MKPVLLFLVLAIFIRATLSGQEKISLERYDRAIGFLWDNVNNKKAFNLHIQPNWFPDSTGMWYEWHSEKEKQFHKITLPDLKKSAFFDQERLASVLTDSLGEEMKANSLPISKLTYIDKNTIGFTVKGNKYSLDLAAYRLILSEPETKTGEFEKLSPDKKWIAFSMNHNLYIKSTSTGDTIQLSSSGAENYEYASWYGWGDIMEGENGRNASMWNGLKILSGFIQVSVTCDRQKKCTCSTGARTVCSGPGFYPITGDHREIRTWCISNRFFSMLTPEKRSNRTCPGARI